jgi:hypothetical protein
VAAFIASGIAERLADDGRSADIIGALSFTGSLILFVASQCKLRGVVWHTCFELRMSGAACRIAATISDNTHLQTRVIVFG